MYADSNGKQKLGGFYRSNHDKQFTLLTVFNSGHNVQWDKPDLLKQIIVDCFQSASL